MNRATLQWPGPDVLYSLEGMSLWARGTTYRMAAAWTTNPLGRAG